MKALALSPRDVGAAVARAVVEPLPPTRFIAAAAVLTAAATLYCQLYCLIAFQPVQAMPMPVDTSVAWAVSATLPWLVCFELSKRRSEFGNSTAAGWLVVVAAFLGAAMLSVVLELGLDQVLGVHETRPLAFQLAAQLPSAMVIGALLIVGPFMVPRVESGESAAPSDPLHGLLALVHDIEWIEAAGNYVEAHAGGKVSLHRLTMRELERSLDPGRFVRIHRSTIVSAAHIDRRESSGGAPAVRLKDGTILKLGPRYAGNLESTTA